MHKLRAALERHIPQIRIISQKKIRLSQGPAVEITGYMGDLRKEPSEFNIMHFERGGGFYASVMSTDTRDGRETLERFKGAFGPDSSKPRLVHRGEDNIRSEFWSQALHQELAEDHENLARMLEREIIEKN